MSPIDEHVTGTIFARKHKLFSADNKERGSLIVWGAFSYNETTSFF